jgi:hypothetical protein
MDYCTAGPQYASGGFIADSQTGFIINGSQQQFFVRDSNIGGWSNGVWNQVFAGVVGALEHLARGFDHLELDTVLSRKLDGHAHVLVENLHRTARGEVPREPVSAEASS